MPNVGDVFDSYPSRIDPLPMGRVMGLLFPPRVQLCRAKRSQPSERVALLIHGLGLNEDYFGLICPELVARGYDVWALRLPGYVASGEDAGLWPTQLGLSLQLYGWVAASTMAHLARSLEPRPRFLLAWGHSLGAAVLSSAVSSFVGSTWAGPDLMVFEAPAFSEALAFGSATLAGFSAIPETVLNQLARAFLLDDLHSSEFARQQVATIVPGRTSRSVFTMNVWALANPLNRTGPPPDDLLSRSWFVIGKFDRLIDHDRLVELLDFWGVSPSRRLVLPRNHLLALTCPKEIVEWVQHPELTSPIFGVS